MYKWKRQLLRPGVGQARVNYSEKLAGLDMYIISVFDLRYQRQHTARTTVCLYIIRHLCFQLSLSSKT